MSENEDTKSLDELDAMFGQDDTAENDAENKVLSQNLEGFASCFPEWDLHPPVNM
jgi:hypothetical protein